MNNKEYKVSCHLFHKQLDIVTALTSVAGQENCDDEEYDLMVEAAEYIRFLRKENKKLKELLPDVLNTLETLEPYNDKEEIQARVEEALSDDEPEPEPKPPIVVNEALQAAYDDGYTKSITSNGKTIYSSKATSRFFTQMAEKCGNRGLPHDEEVTSMSGFLNAEQVQELRDELAEIDGIDRGKK